GWFRHGCPTSQIAKPEVKGAIYRIRKKGAAPVDDPRGLKLDWEKMKPAAMSRLLADSRPAVAERAVAELALKNNSTASLKTVLQESEVEHAKRNAVWALSRMRT